MAEKDRGGRMGDRKSYGIPPEQTDGGEEGGKLTESVHVVG